MTYTNLLTSGKLNSHLAEIQQTAQRQDGADRGADGQEPGRDRGTESQRPDEVGADDEQPAECGGGNGAGGADLQLIDEPEESAGGEQLPALLDEKADHGPSSPTKMMT